MRGTAVKRRFQPFRLKGKFEGKRGEKKSDGVRKD